MRWSRADYADIRRRLDAGERWASVLSELNTTQAAVRRAFHRRGWPSPRASRFSRCKLPIPQAQDYARRRWGKDTIALIANDLGVSVCTVGRWALRGNWGVLRRGRLPRIDWADVRRRLDRGEWWQGVLAHWRTSPAPAYREFKKRGWPTPYFPTPQILRGRAR